MTAAYRSPHFPNLLFVAQWLLGDSLHSINKKGKNVDLYSAYRVLHTSNVLSSLN